MNPRYSRDASVPSHSTVRPITFHRPSHHIPPSVPSHSTVRPITCHRVGRARDASGTRPLPFPPVPPAAATLPLGRSRARAARRCAPSHSKGRHAGGRIPDVSRAVSHSTGCSKKESPQANNFYKAPE
eukprot:gene10102-biopygen7738